tara:strand:- start:589 stop:1233 length:645 start_codon:yes stop_codon:yes gene_type:complete
MDGTPQQDKDGKLLWKEFIVGKDTYDEICDLSEIGEKDYINKIPSNISSIKSYTYKFNYNFWLYSASLSFINTFNILSASSIKEYVEFIFNLRVKYNEFRDRQMVWFDLPILEYPNWLTIDILTEDFLQYMWDAEYYMKENSVEKTSPLIGFDDFEIEKLQRIIRHIEDKVYEKNDFSLQRKNFKLYIDQLDKRRNTNFLKVFPEYKEFYNLCN